MRSFTVTVFSSIGKKKVHGKGNRRKHTELFEDTVLMRVKVQVYTSWEGRNKAGKYGGKKFLF